MKYYSNIYISQWKSPFRQKERGIKIYFSLTCEWIEENWSLECIVSNICRSFADSIQMHMKWTWENFDDIHLSSRLQFEGEIMTTTMIGVWVQIDTNS